MTVDRILLALAIVGMAAFVVGVAALVHGG
jgi:hypothetical protein